MQLEGGKIHAMNPAHILRQLLTDSRWGRGLPPTRFDEPSWREAADTFHAEGLGLCLVWHRQDDIERFAQTVLDHAGAVLYTHRRTGRLVLRAIRGGYDVDSLPHFGYDSGLVAIEDDEIGSPAQGTSEIVVKWRDPIERQDRSTRARNLAMIHATGANVRSSTRDFPGLPTLELAARVAQRELAAASGYSRKMRLRLTRQAADIAPGDVFCISAPERGIERMVLRAGRCEYGSHHEPDIRIDAVQDVFGMSATAWGLAEEQSGWQPPAHQPAPVRRALLLEAPWRDLFALLQPNGWQPHGPVVPQGSAWVMALAQRPASLMHGYELHTAHPGEGEDPLLAANAPFTPTGTLGQAIDQGQRVLHVVGLDTAAASIRKASAAVIVAPDPPDPPEGDASPGPDAAGSVRHPAITWPVQEIVLITSVQTLPGAVQLGVGRGCLDTVAHAWPQGSRIWFYDDASADSPLEYTQGLHPSFRLRTRSATGLLPEQEAPVLGVALHGRAARPYPVGRVRINDAVRPPTLSALASLKLSWAGRDRLAQSDRLIDEDAGHIQPLPDAAVYGLSGAEGVAGTQPPQRHVHIRLWHQRPAPSASLPRPSARLIHEVKLTQGPSVATRHDIPAADLAQALGASTPEDLPDLLTTDEGEDAHLLHIAIHTSESTPSTHNPSLQSWHHTATLTA